MEAKYQNACLHLSIFIGSLVLLMATGQNPRVLLYAHCLALVVRMPTVWLIANKVQVNPDSPLLKFTRLPTQFDKGKPYRNNKTREPAGLASHISASLTLLFMVGLILYGSEGGAFLALDTLTQELAWGVLIAMLFWLDDVLGKQLIVAPKKQLVQNLGYNTPAGNFMLAAIFITCFALLILAYLSTWVMVDAPKHVPSVAWAILVTLSILKLIFQLKVDFSNPKGFADLSKRSR